MACATHNTPPADKSRWNAVFSPTLPLCMQHTVQGR
jgi:hypothetical protein